MCPACIGLGSLGASCDEAYNNWQTFTRLSQKKEKSAQTRANAASNATHWQNVYNDCQLKAATAQAQATQAAITQSVERQAAAQSQAAGSTGSTSGLDTTKIMVVGGAALVLALGLVLFLRKR